MKTDTFSTLNNWTIIANPFAASGGNLTTSFGDGNTGGLYWSTNSWNANQISEITVGHHSNYYGPAVRMSGTSRANFNCYVLFSHGDVQKITNGSNISIGSAGLSTFADGETWSLEVNGTTLTVRKNGVFVNSFTDSSIVSGNAGIAEFQGAFDWTITDWTGTGEIAGLPNNYQFVKAASGISVGERIR